MQQLQIQPGGSEFGSVLKSLRLAKSFWSLLILLAILIHLAGFVMVEFVGVLDTKNAEGKTAAKTKPTTTKAAEAKDEQGDEEEDATAPMAVVKTVMSEAMPIAKVAAPLACAVLTAVLGLAVLASLSERTGGSAGFVGAFLWSLILLAMLAPWQHILKDLGLYGALYDDGLTAIKRAKALLVTSDVADKILYYARFIAYPVIALLVWVLVQWKFGRGFKESGTSPEVSVMRPGES
jgi:hypothetical protein